MAGTRQSGIERGRRWGLAAAGGLTALALTVGLGNPWSARSIAGLDHDQVFDRVAPLVRTFMLLRWSTTPAGYGAAQVPNHAAWYAGALTLDLGWPILLFLLLRVVAGGLLARRGGIALLLTTWALTGFTAALAALAGGAVQYVVGGNVTPPQGPGVLAVLAGGSLSLGGVLAVAAASLAFAGLAVGWLPGLAALIGYTAGRLPEWDLDTGEEDTMVDLASRRPAAEAATPGERETLNLAALEALRNARYSYDPDPDLPGRLPDPRTSTFFGDGQY
ncbi:MAG TPA: hypothetical protein VGX23_31345 [Actinocrinis sp.]|nr:hypothetical protein [Actinocrinis sp.]